MKMITNTIYFSYSVSSGWNDLIYNSLRVGKTLDLSTTECRFLQLHGHSEEFSDFLIKLLERDGRSLKELKLNDVNLVKMFTEHCSNLVKLDVITLPYRASTMIWSQECCNLTTLSLAFRNRTFLNNFLRLIFRLNQRLKSVSLFWISDLDLNCLQQLNPLTLEKLHFYTVNLSDYFTNRESLNRVSLNPDSNRDLLIKTIFSDVFRPYPRL